MTMPWDSFVDEVKSGSTVSHIGVLFLETGVYESLVDQLFISINHYRGRSVRVGEIHFSNLGAVEARVAAAWLRIFFKAPNSFFVLVKLMPGESKQLAYERLISRLENEPRVPHGLDRHETTVHFDFDGAEPRGFLVDLRRRFGMLRAYEWDSKASRLHQLCDTLLGISVRMLQPAIFSVPLSKGQCRRYSLVRFCRREARRVGSVGRINGFLSLEGATLRSLNP